MIDRLPQELLVHVLSLAYEVPSNAALGRADQLYADRAAFLCRAALVASHWRAAASFLLISDVFVGSLSALSHFVEVVLLDRQLSDSDRREWVQRARLHPRCRQERNEWSADIEEAVLGFVRATPRLEDLTLTSCERLSLDFVQPCAGEHPESRLVLLSDAHGSRTKHDSSSSHSRTRRCTCEHSTACPSCHVSLYCKG